MHTTVKSLEDNNKPIPEHSNPVSSKLPLTHYKASEIHIYWLLHTQQHTWSGRLAVDAKNKTINSDLAGTMESIDQNDIQLFY